MPLSLAMDDSEFDHGGDCGGGGGLAAVAAVAVAAVDGDWRQKQLATRALGGRGCSCGHCGGGSSGSGYDCRATAAVATTAVAALWWVGAVALAVAMVVAVSRVSPLFHVPLHQRYYQLNQAIGGTEGG